jgi:hypothetical protein
LAQY